MTLEELQPAINLLNNRFKGKIMKPYNLPIKEFIAASQFEGLMPQFQLAYEQSLYNAQRATKSIEDQSTLIIYVVFTEGKISGYNIESLKILAIDLFLKENQIEPALLLKEEISKN